MLNLTSQSVIFSGNDLEALQKEAEKSAKKIGKFLTITHQESEKYVDEVRKIYEYTRGIQKTPLTIIIDTDSLFKSPASQNAFLKVFEEPAPNIHLVLLTTNLEKLLPTIRSRAQHQAYYTEKAIDTRPLEDWLEATTFDRLKTIKSLKTRQEALDHLKALAEALPVLAQTNPTAIKIAPILAQTLDRLHQNGNTKTQLLNLALHN